MNNAQLPLNMREAIAIIQSAKNDNGWMSEEEYKRVQAELRKLGITVIEQIDDKNEPPASNARALVEDVQIHPWAKGRNGNLFNPWCSDEAGEDAGWNVHSFAPDGQGGGEIIDDDDFEDYQNALAHGEALAQKYGVDLRCRTLIMID